MPDSRAPVPCIFSHRACLADCAGELGMGNQPRQLRRYGYQEGLFVLRKSAMITLLDNQHTQEIALVNNRCSEKSVKGLFA